MIFIDTFLYYTVFSSVVLIYGIGVNRLTEIGTFEFNHITFYFKTLLSILSSIVLTWIITRFVLAPIGLIELYPLFALLIFICINSFIEALVRLTTGTSTTEFIVSFLIILLSLSESTSILDSFIICASCFASLLLLLPLIFSLKSRVFCNGKKQNERFYSYFFMFLALLIIIISVLDIAWLNPGVIK